MTPHPPKTLKYYDQSQHQSEKRKCNAFKSPSLQTKIYNERSQQKSPSKKKTRRGPNKSPAKQARNQKRSDSFAIEKLKHICDDDLRNRFQTPESRVSSPPCDMNPEKDYEPREDHPEMTCLYIHPDKDYEPGEDHPEMTFLYRLLCCILIVFSFMIASELLL